MAKFSLKPTLNPFIFEQILADAYFWEYTDKKAMHSYHSWHWLKPFFDNGYAIPGPDIEINSHLLPRDRFIRKSAKATESGIKWWIAERARKFIENNEHSRVTYPQYPGWHVTNPCDWSQASFRREFEGKGIGGQAQVSTHSGLIWTALRDGIFDFVSHADYCGMPHGASESVTVALTKKGMDYFDAIPRMVEVW